MGLLEILLGDGREREGYEDFVRRFDEGPPWEGYGDDEVMTRYGQVSHEVPPADYERAVREALSRLTPRQQAELGRYLQARAGERGESEAPGPEPPADALDGLARSVRELHERPGHLREVLAGGPSGRPASRPPVPEAPGRDPGSAGPGSIFDNPLAKALLAGITAMLVRRLLASRR